MYLYSTFNTQGDFNVLSMNKSKRNVQRKDKDKVFKKSSPACEFISFGKTPDREAWSKSLNRTLDRFHTRALGSTLEPDGDIYKERPPNRA